MCALFYSFLFPSQQNTSQCLSVSCLVLISAAASKEKAQKWISEKRAASETVCLCHTQRTKQRSVVDLSPNLGSFNISHQPVMNCMNLKYCAALYRERERAVSVIQPWLIDIYVHGVDKIKETHCIIQQYSVTAPQTTSSRMSICS